MDETDLKLSYLQQKLSIQMGMKLDLYREEGKGVLVVPHGMDLIPRNVIYAMTDDVFLSI